MDIKETTAYLHKEFARRFPHATLTITSRTIKGKKRYYFKTVGVYKVESGSLIELFFETAYRYKQDLPTLTYHYKTE